MHSSITGPWLCRNVQESSLTLCPWGTFSRSGTCSLNTHGCRNKHICGEEDEYLCGEKDVGGWPFHARWHSFNKAKSENKVMGNELCVLRTPHLRMLGASSQPSLPLSSACSATDTQPKWWAIHKRERIILLPHMGSQKVGCDLVTKTTATITSTAVASKHQTWTFFFN